MGCPRDRVNEESAAERQRRGRAVEEQKESYKGRKRERERQREEEQTGDKEEGGEEEEVEEEVEMP